MQNMKKTPKCDKCGKRYFINHPTGGVPVMLGFQLEDGSVLNYCYKCIEEIGKESASFRSDAYKENLMEDDT